MLRMFKSEVNYSQAKIVPEYRECQLRYLFSRLGQEHNSFVVLSRLNWLDILNRLNRQSRRKILDFSGEAVLNNAITLFEE